MFYAGQAFSYVGDGLRTLALPLLVFHLTGSALSLGITYALEFLPFAVTGLIGGSLADRLDRRRLLLSCDFVRFFIIAFFAVAYWRGFLTLPMLYVGIVIIAMCARSSSARRRRAFRTWSASGARPRASLRSSRPSRQPT